MWFLLPSLAIGASVIYLSKTLEMHNFYWAHQVCSSTWGLCNYSEWLLMGTGLVFVSYLLFNRNTA